MACPEKICRPAARRERAGFTLIELLVVMAIISLLAAILFPVFGQARKAARQTVCVSNLRQVGLALSLYREDYGDLPPHISTLVPAYVSAPRLLVCPNDPKQGQYGDGDARFEGNQFLASGVSYDYPPQWTLAQALAWWELGPPFGAGKWEDLTPVVECQWHWATQFHANWTQNAKNARGWELVLTMAGTVRRLRVEEPIANFTPERYR